MEVRCSGPVRDIATRRNSFALLQGDRVRFSSKFFPRSMDFSACHPVHFSNMFAGPKQFIATTTIDNELCMIQHDDDPTVRQLVLSQHGTRRDRSKLAFASSAAFTVIYRQGMITYLPLKLIHFLICSSQFSMMTHHRPSPVTHATTVTVDRTSVVYRFPWMNDFVHRPCGRSPLADVQFLWYKNG